MDNIWLLARVEYPTDKLLAFKPFLLNQEEMKLYPATLPDWEWPDTQIVTSPCPLHPDEPAEDCTCGVYSSLDSQAMAAYWAADFNMISDVFPVLGVIQVLGQTHIDGLTLRSWGAFLWGLVRPRHWKGDEIAWLRLMRSHVNDWYERFNPVRYEAFTQALVEVYSTLQVHKLDRYVQKIEKELGYANPT